jgi:CRISPR-associated protein Csm3
MYKLKCHEITGVIHCLSGLRISGSDDLLQIGGTDLTCIKHPVTLKPYLPGSSLKGKMRSGLEQWLNKIGESGKPCGCKQSDCLICRVFGPHAKPQHQLGPARIIVRDGQLIVPEEALNSSIPLVFTERKSSTAIDRNTGAPLVGSLRSEELVIAGSLFALRIVIQEWDIDAKVQYENLKKAKRTGCFALAAFVLDGLKLVQQTGLGSRVSSGSGEIQFEDLKLDGQPIPEDLW